MATAIAPAAHGRGVTHAPASAAATVRERLPTLICPGQKRWPETSTASASVAKVSPSRWRRQPVNTPRDLAEVCLEAAQSLQNTHWRRLTEWLNAWQPVVAKHVASHSDGDSAKPSRVMPGMVERSGCARLVQHGPSKGATAQYRGTMAGRWGCGDGVCREAVFCSANFFRFVTVRKTWSEGDRNHRCLLVTSFGRFAGHTAQNAKKV